MRNKKPRYLELSKEATKIFVNTLISANHDFTAAREALEDGEWLTKAGYTDKDQEPLEEAHYALREFEQGKAQYITTPSCR
jgi:hypothetical protein